MYQHIVCLLGDGPLGDRTCCANESKASGSTASPRCSGAAASSPATPAAMLSETQSRPVNVAARRARARPARRAGLPRRGAEPADCRRRCRCARPARRDALAQPRARSSARWRQSVFVVDLHRRGPAARGRAARDPGGRRARADGLATSIPRSSSAACRSPALEAKVRDGMRLLRGAQGDARDLGRRHRARRRRWTARASAASGATPAKPGTMSALARRPVPGLSRRRQRQRHAGAGAAATSTSPSSATSQRPDAARASRTTTSTRIDGDGVDAELMRGYFAAWGDREAYAVSHVGWGMNPAARWDAMTFYDKRDFNGTELRAFAGNFLYSHRRQRSRRPPHARPLRPAAAQLHGRARRRGGRRRGRQAARCMTRAGVHASWAAAHRGADAARHRRRQARPGRRSVGHARVRGRRLSRGRLGHAGLRRLARRSSPTTWTACARALVRLLDRPRGARRVVLLGHSMGGMVAQEAGRAHPDAGAAAWCCAAPSPAFGGRDGDVAARVHRPAPRRRSMRARPWPSMAPTAGAGHGGPASRPGGVRLATDVHGARAGRHLPRGAATRSSPSTGARRSAAIAVPTLLLAGEHDRDRAARGDGADGRSASPAREYAAARGRRPPREPRGARRVRRRRARRSCAALRLTEPEVRWTSPADRRRGYPLTAQQRELLALAARARARELRAARRAVRPRGELSVRELRRPARRPACSGCACPKRYGGLGADFATYVDGRRRDRPLLRRHRAHLQHARLLDDVDRRARRRPRHDAPTQRAEHERRRALHFERIVQRRRESTRSPSPKAAPPPPARRRSAPLRAQGRRRLASSTAGRSSPRCRARPTTTACCAPRTSPDAARMRDTLYLAVPGDAPGVSIVGDWDPLGMRGTVVAHAAVQGRVRARRRAADAARRLLPGRAYAGRTCSSRCRPPTWASPRPPTTSPWQYLRGEVAGQPPVKRRMYPTKQIAVAEMRIKLEQTRALFLRAIARGARRPDEGRAPALLRGALHDHGERQRHRARWRSAPAAASRC